MTGKLHFLSPNSPVHGNLVPSNVLEIAIYTHLRFKRKLKGRGCRDGKGAIRLAWDRELGKLGISVGRLSSFWISTLPILNTYQMSTFWLFHSATQFNFPFN